MAAESLPICPVCNRHPLSTPADRRLQARERCVAEFQIPEPVPSRRPPRSCRCGENVFVRFRPREIYGQSEITATFRRVGARGGLDSSAPAGRLEAFR